MKIHQIAMGTRFVFDGEEYTKTGPMVATGASGQRLIPKYAVLHPIGEAAGTPSPAPSPTLPRISVLKAFDAFYAQCETWVPQDKRAALAAARAELLRRWDDPTP